MKLFQKLVCMALTATATASLSICAFAADYTFDTAADTDYYPSTSYEDTYGTAYHYGSKNLVDYQIPELPYGVLSTTQTGVMEKLRLPGLQQTVGGSASGIYGVDSGVGIPAVTPVIPSYQEPAYTSAKDMERKDGSIGTLKIPSLDINMKVWEGETNESMKKGLGHYSSTSAWDGNIGVCGHNRGAKYTIGSIKDLEIGDTITYTTIYGTRTYEVVLVKTISNSDWSYLQATADNRILCELRKDMAVSDRKYLGYYPIAQAKAWLSGHDKVESCDLLALKNYLWRLPSDREKVEAVLTRLCVNPMQDKVNDIRGMALESQEEFDAALGDGSKADTARKAFIKLRGELTHLYQMQCSLRTAAQSDSETALVDDLLADLEKISRKAHEQTHFTYTTLEEITALN